MSCSICIRSRRCIWLLLVMDVAGIWRMNQKVDNFFLSLCLSLSHSLSLSFCLQVDEKNKETLNRGCNSEHLLPHRSSCSESLALVNNKCTQNRFIKTLHTELVGSCFLEWFQIQWVSGSLSSGLLVSSPPPFLCLFLFCLCSLLLELLQQAEHRGAALS